MFMELWSITNGIHYVVEKLKEKGNVFSFGFNLASSTGDGLTIYWRGVMLRVSPHTQDRRGINLSS